MRDIERIDKFCNRLKELWRKHPDLRFWQLISVLCEYLPKQYYDDPFYMEDGKWLMTLELAINDEEQKIEFSKK